MAAIVALVIICDALVIGFDSSIISRNTPVTNFNALLIICNVSAIVFHVFLVSHDKVVGGSVTLSTGCFSIGNGPPAVVIGVKIDVTGRILLNKREQSIII